MKKLLVGAGLIGMLAVTAAVHYTRDDGGRPPAELWSSPVSLPAPGANTIAPSTGYSKVLVIVDENKTFTRLITKKGAPYLAALGKKFGLATAMDAGYPTACQSLGAYIIMTSGSRQGICDGKDPAEHPLSGPSVFSQTTAAGKQWRLYAEDMPANCAQNDHELFVVRHAPSNYYTDLRDECLQRSVPMGTLQSGAFRQDIDGGTLPDLSFAIPNLCNDMHSAKACPEAVPIGDDWLSTMLPIVTDGPDYRSGRLAIFIAFDEGTRKDNHIPFVVVSPTTGGITVSKPTTLCSILATMSDLLSLDPLGCAADAESLAADFKLAGQ